MSDFDDPDDDEYENDGEEELPSEEPLSEYEQALRDVLDSLGLSNIEDFHPIAQGDAEHPEDIRGDRFESLGDALIFLASIGVIDFSEVIDFGDGTYGVEIGDSGQPT
jgi:hypothetical protein